MTPTMNHTAFMSRVYAFASTEDAAQVDLAYDLAKKLHKGQFRKELEEDGKPARYFVHLRRVALHLMDAGVTDCNVIIAALLHDSIEDTEEVRLVSKMVESLFGNDVGTMVRQVTKIPKEGYIERLRAGIPRTYGRAVLVKLADRLDNLSTLPADDTAFCEKQYAETRYKLMPIFSAARQHLPPALSGSYELLFKKVQKMAFTD